MNLVSIFRPSSGSSTASQCQTRPGRIGPAPIIPTSSSLHGGNTAQVKPYYRNPPTRNASQPSLVQQSQKQPSPQRHEFAAPCPADQSSPTSYTNGDIRGTSATPSLPQLPPGVLESPSKREIELQKLYTAQCKQVRSLLDDKQHAERRLAKLEDDLQKITVRYQKLETNFDRQSEEIDCLRHEISWKDLRIEELQGNLYRLASMLPDDALNSLHDSS